MLDLLLQAQSKHPVSAQAIKVMHKLGHKQILIFFFFWMGANYAEMTFSKTSLESENEWETILFYKSQI